MVRSIPTFFAFLLIVSIMMTSTVLAITPKQHDAVLEERTQLYLEMSPGLSTRLVFPFIIDPEMNDPAFKISIPNSAVFKIESDEMANLQGQNNLVIKADMLPNAKNIVHHANVFISVNGYHITISLKLTHLQSKHYYTDVFFQLSEKEQNYLIDKIVDRRLADLEKRYQDKSQEIDSMAAQAATKNISHLALAEQKSYQMKEDFKISFESGERVELYLDKIVAYGEHYFVLVFELSNLTQTDIALNQWAIKVDETLISTEANCASVLKKRETLRCALVTHDPLLFKPKRLIFEMVTSLGRGRVEW